MSPNALFHQVPWPRLVQPDDTPRGSGRRAVFSPGSFDVRAISRFGGVSATVATGTKSRHVTYAFGLNDHKPR